ncbi:MAG: DUF4920 domain-containing protein [Bacteroidetes bacterium]|nr:MAG: DUF4920 domain-containing protein [Bacteroidota bacterium]
MKKFSILFSLSLVLLACSEKAAETQAPAASTEAVSDTIIFPADSLSPDGSRSFHGLRISESDAVAVSQLTTLIENKGEIPVKLEGEVAAACQAKGCWMTMKLADGQDMRVRFKDYGFFVPKDSPGKMAVIEGRAFRDTTSVEELRHYAVDGGMSEAEAEKKFTEPKIAINFEATGVVIKSKP